MPHIQSANAELYYEESGSGKPLILLPGLLGTIETHWAEHVPLFSKSFRTIAVDLRGHGKSTTTEREIRLPDLVDDLATIIETLRLGAVSICGYSLGGYIALAHGVASRSNLRGLVMHGTKFFWSPESIETIVRGLTPEHMKAETLHRLRREHPATGDIDALLRLSMKFITSLSESGLNGEQATRASFPVMVSRCVADEFVTHDEAKRLTQLLPRGRLEEFDECKHSLASLSPSVFTSTCIDFFNWCPAIRINQERS